MPAIIVHAPDGTRQDLEAADGQALMEPLRDADLVEATCGGAASCGTCHIYLAEKWFAAAGERIEEEDWMLEALEDEVEVKDSSRLACQVKMTAALDGIELEIAPQI